MIGETGALRWSWYRDRFMATKMETSGRLLERGRWASRPRTAGGSPTLPVHSDLSASYSVSAGAKKTRTSRSSVISKKRWSAWASTKITASGLDCLFFSIDAHAGASADDVVEFVLVVGLLRIGCVFRQRVEAGTHGGNAEEFDVSFAGSGAGLVDVGVSGRNVESSYGPRV